MVKEKRIKSGKRLKNLWSRLKAIRGVVRKWQGDRFSLNENQIREYEESTREIRVGQKPSNPREMAAIQENKLNLMIELNKKRLVEESMCK